MGGLMDNGHVGKAAVSSRQREAAEIAALCNGQATNGEAEDKPAGALPYLKGSRGKYFRDYAQWLAPYRVKLSVIFILALVVAALELIPPLAIKMVIDKVLTPAANT